MRTIRLRLDVIGPDEDRAADIIEGILDSGTFQEALGDARRDCGYSFEVHQVTVESDERQLPPAVKAAVVVRCHSESGPHRCGLEAGHEGNHIDGNTAWPRKGKA